MFDMHDHEIIFKWQSLIWCSREGFTNLVVVRTWSCGGSGGSKNGNRSRSQQTGNRGAVRASAKCSRADSMRLLVLAAVVMLSTLQANVRARYPSQSQEVSFCPILDEYCQCSVDLQEFICRAAGFTTVPSALPHSITKL